jgi:hypothetical protein
VPIEKAFAIRAPARDIYAALERDIAGSADDDEFAVMRRVPDRELELRVRIAGIPCWLTYRLDPRPDYTEVVAMLIPFGFRYAFFKMITLGLRDQGFELALVQGLANLKDAVEGEHGAPGDIGAEDGDGMDE